MVWIYVYDMFILTANVIAGYLASDDDCVANTEVKATRRTYV